MKRATIPVHEIKFGDFRRLRPISQQWGFDRGLPVDRYYIDNFLARNEADVQGRVLEIGDDSYTRKFGGDRVTAIDVLHPHEGSAQATIVADLANAAHVPSDQFDCIIFTQTLQLIYDTKAALATLGRILKPGGVLLATFPGITHIGDYQWQNSWYWNFTSHSARRLFDESFGSDHVRIETHGNVLAATAFLHGLAAEELTTAELDVHDPIYEVLLAVRAVRAEERASRTAGERTA